MKQTRTDTDIIGLLEENINLRDELGRVKKENDLKPDKEDYNILYNELLRANLQQDRQVRLLFKSIFGDALFRRDEIVIGDSVAGLEYVDDMIGFQFKGEVSLKGTFRIDDEGPYENTVVFEVSRGYYHLLPREEKDFRTLWFTFTNNDEIIDDFLLLENKEVEIVINSYMLTLVESDVNNTAYLVEIKTN